MAAAPERSPGVADVREVLGTHLSDYRVEVVEPLGGGQENVAYLVNDELVVRFSREPDPARRAALVRREDVLLAAVAPLSPLPVPEPLVCVPGRGCLVYRRLPGAPLLDVPAERRAVYAPSVGATLGGLLAALHATPVETMSDLVNVDDQPPVGWLDDARECQAAVAGRIPSEHRPAVAEFLSSPPPEAGRPLVFSHNDLGIEHVLVRPNSGAVTGIIDWGDAALVDPAYDFGLVLRDLGPAALEAALSSYRSNGHDTATLAARAAFYARCSVFEDLEYGVDSHREEYVTKSLVSLAWLFPPVTS